MKPTLSAVVPVYNSEESLPELLRRLSKVLESVAREYEIILVNDGSRDRSWEALQELTRQYSHMRIFNLTRNFGQHNALLAGIRQARHELIVTLDDDLQNPPEEIPKLLEKLEQGFDVVYGRPDAERHGFFRDLASRLVKQALTGVLGAESAKYISAFRVFRTLLRESFPERQSSYVSIDVLLTWGTTRFSYVFVEHKERLYGRSNYSLRKLIRHAFNMTTGFSILPLQLVSVLGFVFTLFGVAVLLYVLIRWALYDSPVQGFPFLASIISIFSGVQIFSLGILGEYLGRIHVRTQERPMYMIRESIESKGKE